MEDNFYLRNSEGLVTVDKPSDAILTDFREQCIEMIVFNVGEGEAMLVKARNKAIFIDGGADKSKERNVTLGNALRKYLAGNGIKLNAIVASHNHTDHLNALSTMLSGEDPPILATEACFYCNGEKIPLKLEKTWKKLQKLRKNNKIKIIEISELTPINWIGDQRITMLIDGRKKPKPEYRSIFMHIPYREATFLLTGDAYRAYEKELLKDPNASQYMKTDVLKITHHGSKGGKIGRAHV